MKKYIALATALTIANVAFAEVALTPPTTPEQASSLVTIDKTPITLESHLKRKYSAYKISVTSEYPEELKISSASIQNGVTGSLAAQKAETSWVNILWGLPLGFIGMGIAAVVIFDKNHKAENEASDFQNQPPSTTLHKGDIVTFDALVPNQQPLSATFHFKDCKTGLTFDVGA
jgi:hypothetical protein